MDCAAFERTLTKLLAEELDTATRDRRLAALREHAAGCTACRAGEDLLELATTPAGERDPVSDPGPDYWQGFEGRVRERIDRQPAATGRRGAGWLAAAAALVVIVLGGWAVLRSPEPTLRVAESPEPARPATTPTAEPESVRLPEELERQLAAAGPALPEEDALAGWGTGLGGESSGAFPDVSDLDGETQQELLRWLKEQAS